jgi:hypothetical protein
MMKKEFHAKTQSLRKAAKEDLWQPEGSYFAALRKLCVFA